MKSFRPALLVLVSPWPAAAGTLHVPEDYPTIASALAASSAGTLVEIACGTYYEHDLELKTGVVVSGATGQPECVVIDAERAGRVFVADGVAGCDLVGITIRNGLAAAGASGGGLSAVNSTVSLSCCTFFNCAAEGSGGAFHAESSLLTIDICRFEQNIAAVRGGALHGDGAETHLIGCSFVGNMATRHAAVYLGNAPFAVYEACRFESNTADSASGAFGAHDSVAGLFGCELFGNSGSEEAGAALVTGASSVLFQGCVFRGNEAAEGGALVVGPGAEADVQRCTFDANRTVGRALGRGGGVRVEGGTVTLERTAFLSNAAESGDHLFLEAAGCDVSNCIFAFGVLDEPIVCGNAVTLAIGCTDVWSNAGGNWVGCLTAWDGIDGNFAADPLFCDPDGNDYSIRSDSPCAAAASGCGLVGPIDVGCEPASVRAETWAGIKSRYR